ncbi:PAP/25A-associated domain-containing protein [Cavenderia fasciculata]|uniref:PAP/25A-associated domain-containing protein n=1 Tax=Cavenderia fasciculata TaxID=261658 RepID=F4PYV0_CACFS|nr:PAP/25A-associated domain-containing protein [Cavenderia fasciculata]EGG18979.1 PAP/25A-associated domain-containing protein [Cavenderia fasciculata]|eukprot:XP_004357458.1 PAP/25A-associated domain-containing protein [Cavenderia fasciculata]
MLKRKKSPRSASPSSSPPHQSPILQQQQQEQQQQQVKSLSTSNNSSSSSSSSSVTVSSSSSPSSDTTASDQKSLKQNNNNNNNNGNVKLKKKKSHKNNGTPSSSPPTKSLNNLAEKSNNEKNTQKEYKNLEDLHLTTTTNSINSNIKKSNQASEFIPLSSAPVQIQNSQTNQHHHNNNTNNNNNNNNNIVTHRKSNGGESTFNGRNYKSKSIIPPLWLQGLYNAEELSKLELEKEIVMFYDWLAPNPLENRLRQKIVHDVESIIRESWPHAEIHIFGSFSTDLCIPSSDIDIQISGINDRPNNTSANKSSFIYDPIREFYNILNRKHHTTYTNMRLIAGAKVPIIKLVHRDTWYNVDICFDTPNGIENTTIVKSFLKKYKSMKLLLLLLKFFLFQNKLNETYTGGIGSYALALMVASYVQLRYVPYQERVINPRRAHSRAHFKHAGDDTDYGAMVIEFLELYGRSFQYTQHAISLEHNGYYYQKEPQLGIYLTLIDPHDRNNDVGKNSFNISFIRGVFTNALVKIVSTDFVNDKYPSIIYPTLLSRVIDERQVEQISRDRNRVLKLAQQLSENNQLPLLSNQHTPECDFDNKQPFEKDLSDDDDDQQVDEDIVNNRLTSRSFVSVSSSPSTSSDEYSDESIQFIDSSSDVHSSSSSHGDHHSHDGSSDSEVSDNDEAFSTNKQESNNNDKNFFGW